MRTLSLRQSFQGILAWDSFFHLTPADQRGMFDVFREHAAPSTVLTFNAGPSHGEAIGSYRGDPLYHASLDPAEYATLLKGIGFKIVAHVLNDLQAGGRTVWSRRRASSRFYSAGIGVAGAVGAVAACEGAEGPLSGRSSIAIRNAMPKERTRAQARNTKRNA